MTDKRTLIEFDDRCKTYREADGTIVSIHSATGHRLIDLRDLESLDDHFRLWLEQMTRHMHYGTLPRYPNGRFGKRPIRRPNFTTYAESLELIAEDLNLIEDIKQCRICDHVDWTDEGRVIYDEFYPYSGPHRHNYVQLGWTCDGCIEAHYINCNDCSESIQGGNATTVGGYERVCGSCLEEYIYCNHCSQYYHGDSDEDHTHSCECLGDCSDHGGHVFQIRNDGDEPLVNDHRVKITLPAGTIDDIGIDAMERYIIELPHEYRDVREAWRYIRRLGDKWQTKDGNFTKRFSRMAHKQAGIKVPPAVLSQLGVIASNHSAPVDFHLEITRDFRGSAEDFGNSGSCWWGQGGYGDSRCCLRTNGGFGLRTFDGPDGGVTGRAWVMPLKAHDAHYLTPTFETEDAAAFVIFNLYGDLAQGQGYTPARMMAHMAGMTYRKISLSVSGMYINNSMGYLVAPEELATHYTDGSLSFSLSKHSGLFQQEESERAAALAAIEAAANRINLTKEKVSA